MPDFNDYFGDGSSLGASLFDRAAPDLGPDLIPVPPSLPQPSLPFPWTEEQVQAIHQVVAWRQDPSAPRYLKFTGAAGAGKTTALREVRRLLAGSRVQYAAMTGKAALRLRQVLGLREVKTYHSAMYELPYEVDVPEEQKIDLVFSDVKFDPDVSTALLVVDEASMISPKLRRDADASAYEKILLVGDEYQIPPVLSRAEEEEQGGDYSVFTGMAGPHLRRVMRNGGAVLEAATRVRERQEVPTDSGEHGGSRYDYSASDRPDVAIASAIEGYLADPHDHALVTWRNEVRMGVNRVVRLRLGHASDLPCPGEPLVVRRNAHHLRLMNGDVLQCEDVGDIGPTIAGVETHYLYASVEGPEGPGTGRTVQVLVPTRDFSGTMPYVPLATWKAALREAKVKVDVLPVTFGYCLTAHLAQGSGYRRVTTVLPGDLRHPHFVKSTRLPDGMTMPFSMRFLYTALSRAVDRSSLIVSQ